MSAKNFDTPEIVGLIPAGGQATRIAPLPCSKELYPIGFQQRKEGGSVPKVVSQYLLDKMRFAGISKAFFVLRPGKWDIPAYFGDGSMLNMHFAYLTITGPPFGVPFTLDHAYPFLSHVNVAFGFPDILFDSDDAFLKLLSRQSETRADLTLGLFPAEQSLKVDLVETTEDGWVKKMVVPPEDSNLIYTWNLATWTPAFTEYLHEFVRSHATAAMKGPELIAGHVVQSAVRDGLKVLGVPISDTPYLDIGTPRGLAAATRRTAERVL